MRSAAAFPLFPTRVVALLALALTAFASSAAFAKPVTEAPERTEDTPPYLEGVGIDEHLSAHLPLDVAFKDETGKTVHLGDYFDGTHPVVVTMNYARCPMLCSLELSGLVHALKPLAWKAGHEFRLVTVSIDPTETPELARGAQARYIHEYGRPEAASGWHFLSGTDEAIHKVADAFGFRYRYDEKAKQFYHAAALMVATPTGTIARYLYGVNFTPETLRLALVESSEGKIGNTIDKLILYCCAYDPKKGSYAAVANRVMNVAATFILVVLATVLAFFWLAELRKKRKKKAAQEGAPVDAGENAR